MANGFAGAGQSADRRRRRLSHDLADDHDFPIDSQSHNSDGPTATRVWTSEFDTQLLRKVLSPRLWKHVTAITVLVLLTAATIYALQRNSFSSLQHTTSRFASCFLLFSGQLALLIGWVRGESDFDYKGRFRWWTSLAIAILAAAILRLTDSTAWAADATVAMVEFGTGSLNAARPAVLLVPLVIAVALLVYRIIPDMQRCFESQLVMVLTVITLIAMVVWQHMGSLSTAQPIVASLDLSMCVLLFSSLLLHARYVAYVNHDPPVLIQKSVTEAMRDNSQMLKTDDTECPAPTKQPETNQADEPAITAQTTKQSDVTEKKTPKPRKRRKTRRAA